MVAYEDIAKYAFLAFTIIAIIAGLAVGYMAWPDSGVKASDVADATAYVTLILLILGIVVGIIGVTVKEVTPFLIVAIALSIGAGTPVWASLAKIHTLLPYLVTYILNFIVAFVVPVAVILSLKAIYGLAAKKE